LGRGAAHRRAGAGMTAAHEQQRRGQLLVGGAQLAAQKHELALRDALEMMARDLDGDLQAGCIRGELSQLQLDALPDRAGGDARRVELLYAFEDGLDLRGIGLDLGPQRPGDLLEGLRQITIVVDGVDERARDRERPRLETRELELQEQMLLE